ncbi:hypothetical protein H310_06469 [Aphanomyces invadans]|uniref:FYVE-type domain-containing protein n=1 Tax=Aphanomyces invadans TaxID=157072 RepID=A0A024U6Q2_9STRA|nr:hypothetical protein H310_06469 [Aphanomyces invadans]ETW01924.1 hypothetical protein H310_06469 [Aphanomyces invadans]|eukprot:XP_008869772.1 hypothetical protein H310_06469 [Aphanomyces invadans]
MSSSTGRRVAALQNGESFADSTISTAHSDDVGHDFHTAPSHQVKPGEDYCVVWTRNEEVSGCMVCNTKFTLFLRRHHCRSCGDVVCGHCAESKREVYGLVGMHRVCDACLTNGVWMDPVARRRLERLEQSHSIAHEDDDDDGVYFTGQSIDGRNDCRRKTVPGATSTEDRSNCALARLNFDGDAAGDDVDDALGELEEFYAAYAPQDVHLAKAQLAQYGAGQRDLMWRMLHAHYNVSFESATNGLRRSQYDAEDPLAKNHHHDDNERATPALSHSVEWAQAPGKGHNNTVQPEDEHANNADDDACLTESVLGNDSTTSQDERSLSASNVNKAKTVKDHGPEEDEVLEVDDSSMHKHTEIGDNDVGAPVPAVELVQNEVVVTCSVDLPVDGKSSGLEVQKVPEMADADSPNHRADDDSPHDAPRCDHSCARNVDVAMRPVPAVVATAESPESPLESPLGLHPEPHDHSDRNVETLLSDPPDFPDEFVDERPRTLTWVNANSQHFTDKSVPIKALSTPLRKALSRRLTWRFIRGHRWLVGGVVALTWLLKRPRRGWLRYVAILFLVVSPGHPTVLALVAKLMSRRRRSTSHHFTPPLEP